MDFSQIRSRLHETVEIELGFPKTHRTACDLCEIPTGSHRNSSFLTRGFFRHWTISVVPTIIHVRTFPVRRFGGCTSRFGGNVAFPGYDFTSQFADINGFRMHYLDEGRGDTVVMLHGNPNWSYYYRNLVRKLRDRYRCLVPDHIGCGLSEKPSDDRYEYSLARRVDDLEKWLDHCGATTDLTLVVHDWGGMIGMAYATKFPERIRRLVVLNTGAFHLPQAKPVPWQLKLARSSIGAVLVRGLNAFSRGAVRSCVTRHPMPADVANAYCAPYDSWANRIAVHRFVQDIPLKPDDRGYELVSEVGNRLELLKKIPMFIGWGDRDFVFDEHFLREWLARFPDAELHRYPDCGHYILEDASDELVPLISQFLDSHSLNP